MLKKMQEKKLLMQFIKNNKISKNLLLFKLFMLYLYTDLYNVPVSSFI